MLAHLVGAKRRDQGEAGTTLLGAGWPGHFGRCGRARGARAAGPRGLVFIEIAYRRPCQHSAQLQFAILVTETLLCLLLGLALGLLIVPATFLLFAFARLGGVSFGALGGVPHLPQTPLFLGNLSLLRIAQ